MGTAPALPWIRRLAGVAACLWTVAAAATPMQGDGGEPGLLCRRAIRQAELGSALPANLLSGIARVESGRRDPVSGRFHPWPWTINAEGSGYFFDSKAEAIVFARQLQARGVRSFDVGCLQVNLMHHADAFQSLEEAFDPVANARYAVKFLGQLREKTGNWETASAWYHSANPELGGPYRAMVVAAMASEASGATAYASLPALAEGPGIGTAASPLRSMPSGLGNVMMLPGMAHGFILPRPPTAISMASLPGGSGLGGGARAGRGLDAYRMQPVTIASRQVAALK